MAWSAPSEWERWDPDKLIVCPFDPIHRVPAKRYQYHVIKCRENYAEKDFVSCPFNAKHIMLRPELRRHITRCPDRGEVEPYSFKGNELDSKGFYFKGDTSVPCYKKQTASRTLEEDWDRVDEDTTSQQNMCEYYANRASLPAVSRQPVQDLSSLNPSEREQFKRSMRTQAVQSHHYQLNQRNLPECQATLDGSSADHWNRLDIDSIDLRVRDIDTGREPGNNTLNSFPKSQWFQNSTDHRNQVTNETISNSANTSASIRNDIVPLEEEQNHWESKSNMSTSRPLTDRHSKEEHEGSAYSTSGSTYLHQNNGHFGIANKTNNHSLGVASSGMRGIADNTDIPSFRGAGRAKLAEEARKMNFGLRKSGTSVGRGRGILEILSPNSQGSLKNTSQ